MLASKASVDLSVPHDQFCCSSRPFTTLGPFVLTACVVVGHDYDQPAPDLSVLSDLLLDYTMLCFFRLLGQGIRRKRLTVWLTIRVMALSRGILLLTRLSPLFNMLFCGSAGDVVIASMQLFTAIHINPSYLLFFAARSFCNRTTAFRHSLLNTPLVSFRFKNLNRSSFERSYSAFVSQSLH